MSWDIFNAILEDAVFLPEGICRLADLQSYERSVVNSLVTQFMRLFALMIPCEEVRSDE